MARIILPVRPRLSPSSSRSPDLTPPSNNTFRVLDNQVGGGATSMRDRNSLSRNTLESDEGRGGCDEAIASIERSPSSTFVFTAGESSSHVPAPSFNDLAPREGRHSPHGTGFSFTPSPETPQSSSPAVTVSPPPRANPTTTSSVPTPDTRSSTLASGMQNLLISARSSPEEQRSGLDMPEIGHVLDDLANTGNSNAAPQASLALSVMQRGPSRRRSSPRPEPIIHRVEDEEPPSDSFHEPSFQRTLEDTRRALGNLTHVVSSSSIHLDADSTMRGLHERVEKLSRFQPLSTRTVGFVGDSGVGKSSLLNSLLDHRGLARTTNNGAACTCVVTEYHYHREDHFIIEVEEFTSEELQDQLEDLLSCYRHFHSELQHEELNQDDRQDLNEKANIAIDTFRAMFRGNLQDEHWLLEEEHNAILEQFQTWLEVGSGRELPASQSVDTFEICCSLLMQLTSEVAESQVPATWPRIRKIKVFLKAHILSKGLVLVDLPGLRDLNSARRNITERYLLECHEIFAVCNIGRATTDVGVRSVFDLALEARLSHVDIVCTRSDDIDPEEIQDDWGVHHGQTIQQLKTSLNSVQRELGEAEEELDTFRDLPSMGMETHQEFRQVFEAKRNLERQRNLRDYELKEYVVRTRNIYVTDKLTEKYQGQVAGETPHIFCVSNSMYWEKRREEKSMAEPFLNLSGIIAVRKHCNAMVTESQLRESRSFLDNDVPALLSDIELWVQSGAGSASAEEKQAVRRVLDKVERQLRKDLTSPTSLAKAVGPSMKAAFHDNIWQGRDILEWTEASTEACSEWSTWHHSSYAAFCRKWGNHTTQAVGYRNWNKEAMLAMAEDLEGPWEHLQSESENQQVQLNRLIRNSWDEAMGLLYSEWPISSDPPDEIFEAMNCREHLLVAEAEDKFDTFDRRLSILETDALTSIDSSFFGTAMSKVYRQALKHDGSGSDRRRKAVVSSALSNETIFKDLMREFKQRFELHANGLQQEIGEVVSAHLDSVKGTLDLIREENVAEESERDPDFRRRVAEELVRVRMLMRD